MRSQGEIVVKMEEIKRVCRNSQDPAFIQWKTLMHKLEWQSARGFLKPEFRSMEHKDRWEKQARLDVKYLTWEVKEESLDRAAMYVCGEDAEQAGIIMLKILTQVWLLGPTKDKILKILWSEFMNSTAFVYFYEPVFKHVAEEFQVDWNRLKLRYQTGMFTRILDAQGKKIRSENAETDNRSGTGRDGLGGVEQGLGT